MFWTLWIGRGKGWLGGEGMVCASGQQGCMRMQLHLHDRHACSPAAHAHMYLPTAHANEDVRACAHLPAVSTAQLQTLTAH